MRKGTNLLGRGLSKGIQASFLWRETCRGGLLVLCASACAQSENSGPSHDRVPTDVAAELFVRSVGSGDPVLVIHGGPGMDHSYLLPAMDALAESYLVLFYDQRGTGESEAELNAEVISWEGFVTDPNRIQDHFGIDRVHIVAHSFGTLIATAYALEFPERVRSLVLVNPVEPGSRFQEETRAAALARRTEEDASALQRLVASDAFAARDPAAINEMYRLSFRGTLADPERVGELTLEMGERTAANGFEIPALLFPDGTVPNLWGALPSLDVPTLIVVGEADPSPRSIAVEMAEVIPDARLEIIPAAGHFPFVEAPEAFFAAVVRFLEGR